MSDLSGMDDRDIDALVDSEVMHAGRRASAPHYTTDAHKVECVIERMAKRGYSFSRSGTAGHWYCGFQSPKRAAYAVCCTVGRAVCEAALLAVRGAA